MRKLLIILFAFITTAAFSQTYPNNWIDYSKTYYKFKVGKTGVYRITQSTLNSMGLGSTPAEQFQLWKNGLEVRLYTSVASGPLGSSDYIEFWGEKNDGKLDKRLYRDTSYQLSDKYSLETDTSAYFLTVNPAGNNLRFTNTSNNTAGNSLPPEPYFVYTVSQYFNSQINPGYGLPLGEYVYSSSYDVGEGWTSVNINPNFALPYLFDSIYMYTGGGAPAPSFYFSTAGNALNTRNVRVKFYNNIIDDEPLDNYSYLKKTVYNLPSADFPSPDHLLVYIEPVSSVSTDRLVVAQFSLTYPRKFNFNNQPNFYFELPATATGNYLLIDNFNFGGTNPVLLDLTSGNRYTGDITSNPGKVAFVLPASAAPTRRFELISEDVSNINYITALTQRSFVNYSVTSNQGDYLIISNPVLYNDGTGVNNVDLYRAYRSSAAGGGYNAKVYDIDQIIDQFAYGIKAHPLAIKDFIQFAANTFTVKPKYVFLIGKGIVYSDYVTHPASPYDDQLELVPTFGNPASDILLSSPYGSTVPSIPIGRLSVVSGAEIGNYLQKIKEYEAAEASTVQTEANKLWTKTVVHVVGGKDSSESELFTFYMDQYKNIIVDTLYGAHTETFAKSTNSAVQLISGERIQELFDNGISILSYFGHSSATTLEFNLSDPSSYHNQGKYPFFNVSGCIAGNNYIYDSTRITSNNLSISEKFVLANEGGSIGFFASSHLGVPPYLYAYNVELYNQLGVTNYGNTIGNDIRNVISNLGGANPSLDFLTRINMEELNLNGDPALTINPHAKPDYVIEDPDVVVNPAFISVSQSSFILKATAYNIGKALNDSIYFQVKRTYPNGTTDVIYRGRIPGIRYSDSINITIPIVATRDKGLNKLYVTIDADNEVDELSENNNTIEKDVYIYEDEATPSYPADFAIVNVANQKLYASTANPISTTKDYVMEIDTTMLFNSPLKVSRNVNASGGILEFDPGISYSDSTVYYWRVALIPVSGNAADYHWNNSSFVYLANSSPGSNQSHYFQHLYSDTLNIHLDSTSRLWQYNSVTNVIHDEDGVFPTAASLGSDFTLDINGAIVAQSVCGISGIIFSVLDPVSLKPWLNVVGPTGLYGSQQVCGYDRLANFQFNILSQASRDSAAKFLDMIPDNYIVIARNISGTSPSSNTYAADWLADSTAFGVGNTLYDKLRSQGFVLIDSFYRPRSFIFMYQKNNPNFVPDFVFSNGIYDKIELSHQFLNPDTLGYITSPKFGPATAWKQMHWRGSALEPNSPDNPTVQIIGIDSSGNATTLYNVDKTMQDVDISSVNASQYPYIQLKMRNADSVKLTPYQLSYWRLNYTTPPEGALEPNIFYSSKDTLEQGEPLHFGIAFKNISPQAFDSMKVKLEVIDNNNVTHILPVPRQKPLVSGDTIALRYDIDTKNYPGNNTLYVDFNPDNDQPEQYLFNNFLYTSFYVVPDKFNPLLDVTFDGVHILNRDIVSAKPHITVKLTDENKYLSLSDTSLMKVQVQFPDGSLKTYSFDNDTLKFTPATDGSGNNTATIDFTPSFAGNDGDYVLIISGKDVAGNTAGNLNYQVDFRIISKPMISNLLNYPNPFTTSTAFVFTVTGTDVPQNIRIEILTITGKIVREITKDELGPLHIGRNITEFKWDGTDMYGQKVANGVYLYRVLTNLNGKSLDKFTDTGDNTDQYFTKGYGKMYLMR
ncbi:MAG TPA: C25 family cysteine peptidase [Chitinophagaceae bacterium]|nr:C25 family cysteine peptidase [Chitinophagaceae bacterium]